MIALTAVIFGTAYNAGLGMPISMIIAFYQERYVVCSTEFL